MSEDIKPGSDAPEPASHAGELDDKEDSIHTDLTPLEETLRKLAFQKPDGSLDENGNNK